MDNAANEALSPVNSGKVRRYTDWQCPKAGRRRLKAIQLLVPVLLGDPNIVCGTNFVQVVGRALPCPPHLVAIVHS